MNVGRLLDRVYRATSWKYTDRSGIVDMFNDAMSQLTDNAKIEAESQINLVVNQENYPLPPDFKAPINLIDGTIASPNFIYPLLNINEYQYGYSIYNNEILLKPVPQEARTINFYYYKTPAELVEDEDVPEFDSLYHHILASYAVYNIGMTQGMDIPQGMIDRAKTEWIQGAQEFTQSIARKNKRQRVNRKVIW